MTTTALAAPRLFTEADMAESAHGAFGGGSAVVFSRAAPDRTGSNEDAAALIPFDDDQGLLVVADGVGGQRAGAQASGLAISTLATAVKNARQDGGGLREAILNGIESANRAVADLGVGAGSTLSVVELVDGTVRPFHVGDSMILVVGQRGRVKLQTVPHSPTGYAVEAGLLDAQEALHHEERHLVSNLLGTPDMRVEMGSSTELAARDTVLIASDGLSDNLTEDEIIEIIRKGPLQRAAERLANLSRQRMETGGVGDAPSKPDDLTFVLFRMDPTGRGKPGDNHGRRRTACPSANGVV